MGEKTVLVTGGAGYIGTHTVLQLLNDGFRVFIIDNFDNSVEEALNRVRLIAGPDLATNIEFFYGDLRNLEDCEKLFSKTKFDGVIHFAGKKAVGESVQYPMRYFDNNLVGTINLYKTMEKYNCKKDILVDMLVQLGFSSSYTVYDRPEKLVFSSSCTVYGHPEKVPCVEGMRILAVSPYGRTKLYLEEIARDLQMADPEWKIIQLRYFNPIGAHESGKLGENPKGIPNCLMPYITQVAVGRLSELSVFGTDYPTPDGTAIRDYIHIMDLADGHIAALRKLFENGYTGCTEYNLGTGRGTSVLELVAAFEKACGKKIPVKICPRRPGDATAVYGGTEKAEKELGWKAKRGIEQMCMDQWRWASQNPMGYETNEKI